MTAHLSEPKYFNSVNVNLPFPYPILNSANKRVWPFKEEGFVLLYGVINESEKCIIVNDIAAIFTLLKMGFFGFNSNKELNHFFLMESITANEKTGKAKKPSSIFTLGYYSLNSCQVSTALNKFKDDMNLNEQSTSDDKDNSEINKPQLESLKLCFEETFFLSYVFGIIQIVKNPEVFYSINDLWNCFCTTSNAEYPAQFASRYSAYHYFRSKGWIVRNGSKFGADYLLYKEGPPFYHALYSVIVRHKIGNDNKIKWNEISSLIRVSKNSRKELLLCTVTIPQELNANIINNPTCIQHFYIDLIHVNRCNSAKREFDLNSV